MKRASDVPPLVDFRYFSDPDGADRRTILAGVEMARRVAATPPLADWVVGEVFPGAELQEDDELFAQGYVPFVGSLLLFSVGPPGFEQGTHRL